MKGCHSYIYILTVFHSTGFENIGISCTAKGCKKRSSAPLLKDVGLFGLVSPHISGTVVFWCSMNPLTSSSDGMAEPDWCRRPCALVRSWMSWASLGMTWLCTFSVTWPGGKKNTSSNRSGGWSHHLFNFWLDYRMATNPQLGSISVAQIKSMLQNETVPCFVSWFSYCIVSLRYPGWPHSLSCLRTS